MKDRIQAGERATRTLIRLRQTVDLYLASEPEPEDSINMLAHIRDQMEDALVHIGVSLSAAAEPPVEQDAGPVMPKTFGRGQ